MPKSQRERELEQQVEAEREQLERYLRAAHQPGFRPDKGFEKEFLEIARKHDRLTKAAKRLRSDRVRREQRVY